MSKARPGKKPRHRTAAAPTSAGSTSPVGVAEAPPAAGAVVLIPQLWRVDRIEPNPWNPSRMSPEKFEALVDEIRTEGFDEPLQVVAHAEKGPEWVTIIGGEHRWRAARVVGLLEIPVVVKAWDLETQKLKTVRRNAVRGSLDAVKFTHLVNDVLKSGRFDPDEVRKRMGMAGNDKEFRDHYIAVREEKERVAKEAITDGQRKVRAVHDVGAIVRKLMEEFGDTVPRSYMFFFYGGQQHLMVEMTGAVRQFVDMVVAQGMAEDRDLNAVFLEWIGGGGDRR